MRVPRNRNGLGVKLGAAGLSAVLIALLVILVASVGVKSAGGAEGAKLNLGILFLGGSTHLYAAKKLGLFDQEKLDVDLKSLGGGAQVVPLIVSGDIDVGMVNQVSWLLALAQGYDLVAVSSVSKERSKEPFANNLYVRADSPIRTAKDLEGKRVATNTLNNIVTIYVNGWMRKNGADSSKVQWAEVPFPQMPDTVLNNRVDAAFIVEPFGTILRNTGKSRTLASPIAEMYPRGLFFSVLAAKRSWLDKHQDEASRLVKALQRATDRVMGDQKLRLELMTEFTKMSPDLVRQLVVDDHDIRIDMGALALTMDLMMRDGLLKQKLPLEKYVWKDAPLVN